MLMREDVLYYEKFAIYESTKDISRTSYDVISVIGIIGGIS